MLVFLISESQTINNKWEPNPKNPAYKDLDEIGQDPYNPQQVNGHGDKY